MTQRLNDKRKEINKITLSKSANSFKAMSIKNLFIPMSTRDPAG